MSKHFSVSWIEHTNVGHHFIMTELTPTHTSWCLRVEYNRLSMMLSRDNAFKGAKLLLYCVIYFYITETESMAGFLAAEQLVDQSLSENRTQ